MSRSNRADVLIKLLIIGDSGVGKSCLLLRYTDKSFQSSFITTIGIDFKIKTVELPDGKRVKLQIWDTAGQERFKTITTAYYRGAMGMLVVYDVTDLDTFNNIHTWVQHISKHASRKVEKILVGNKADMVNDKIVETEEGKALAQKHGMKFFETSAKTGENVEEAFTAIAADITARRQATEERKTNSTSGSTLKTIKVTDEISFDGEQKKKKSCC